MISKTSNTRWHLMSALAVLTIAVYIRIIGHDFISLDDYVYITQNKQVAGGFSFSGLKWAFSTTYNGNWHPLSWVTHMLDVNMFGLHPGGHHLVNLLLHTVNALLIFHLLAETTGALYRSAMVAALFSVHPLHVESVAWAAERKDVLSTLFFLLTLLAYGAYAKKPSIRLYLLSIILFVLGLMAKSMLVSLPIILFLVDYWPLGRLPIQTAPLISVPFRRIIIEKLPFIAISALSCAVTISSQTEWQAVSKDAALTMAIRLQNALNSIATYLFDTMWPCKLAPFYPLSLPIPMHLTLVSAGILLAVTLFVIYYRQRWPFLISGWLWYLATLLPVIGIVQIGLQSHADRYTYIPSLGIFFAITWGVTESNLCQRLSPRVASAIAGVILLVLSTLCFRQLGYWKNTFTLFSHTLAVTDRNYVAALIIGDYYFAKREFAKAIEYCQIGLSFSPSLYGVYTLQSKLATSYLALGRPDKAISHLKLALIANPQDAPTHYIIGEYLNTMGRSEEAIFYFKKSLALDPEQLDANIALAQLFQRRGDQPGALPYFRAVLRQDPENPDALNAIGMYESSFGNTQAAGDYFTKALQNRPTFVDARRNLELLKSRQSQK